MRSIATSIFIKFILWVLFLGLVFVTLLGAVMVGGTVTEQDLPVNSLGTMDYVDSWEFLQLGSTIAEALYGGVDLTQVERLQNVPSFFYRAEYDDGSYVTNGAGVADASEFVQGHRYFGVYQTMPNGEWNQLAYGSGSSITYPSRIQKGVKWLPNGRTIYPDFPDADTPDYGIASSQALSADTSLDEFVTYSEETDSEFDNNAGWSWDNPCPRVTVYYSFDDTSLAAYEGFWDQSRQYLLEQFTLLGGLGLAAALCALWLLLACGRKPADREAHLLALDHIPTEVTLGLWVATFFGFVGLSTLLASGFYNAQIYKDWWMVNLFCGGLTALIGLFLIFTLSLARQTKARRFLRGSLCFRFLHWCWTICKGCWDAVRGCFDDRAFRNNPLTKALQKRQNVYLIVLGVSLLLMVFVAMLEGAEMAALLMLVFVAGIGLVTYWQTKGNQKTYLEINKGFNESFEEQMKSERTKTALITNVSHDLKTPLTSIITYLDLLEQEELSETARDYVVILAQKSERLKAIVSDLFDLTKSSSGNMPLDLEALDLGRLLEQTMADMRDTIDGSGLPFKVKLPDAPVVIYSDGKKLYRVFQNLIDNSLKYSMAGTRVFVTLDTEGDLAVASVKNTSAYEMEFTAEEVLQRFNRGDKARSGDGSGLGLSIAESFTRACAGDFRVEIDGDLFKVTASFPIDRVHTLEADSAVLADPAPVLATTGNSN